MGQSCDSCEPRGSNEGNHHMRNTHPQRSNIQIPTDRSETLDDEELNNFTGTSSPDYLAPEFESDEQVIEAFKSAIREGNDSLVMHFVEEYPALELLEVEFEGGHSCLQIAVQNKAYKLILCLLTCGASPNARNTVTGDTALHEAVRVKSINTVTLLSKFKADAEIENNDHDTALGIAMEHQYDDIIELLSPETQAWVASNLQTIRQNDDDSLVDEIFEEHDTLVEDVEEDQKNESSEPESVATEEDKTENDPFINLKRVETITCLDGIQAITSKKNKLPKLKGWLEKKQNQMPYKWQKRWILVKDAYVLWSNDRKSINDTKNVKERQQFNNWINLMAITDVKPVTQGKDQRKFIISVGSSGPKNKIRDYLWRCKNKQSRDDWVKGLNEHISHMKSIVSYLDTDS